MSASIAIISIFVITGLTIGRAFLDRPTDYEFAEAILKAA
ncbi:MULTISPECIES: hypothetical protein [Brucella]|nr:hypothetical protein [Brucella melitensis]ADZ65439.1 conserved hypothetical protein [Brucella melitensis M28]AEQ07986.1 hypothetical protein BMNI_I0358 [Brucella melitensis NI]AIJ84885.1 putative fe-superoxide dismutase [Brucella melitensis bv. 3 str. Ether]AIJ89955.1 putative fe-superoxide dismutase [Brucella melitensis bv. 1 str. 16M]AIJ96337.1 putative fe-superoxide dismutase [Brucella melitensis bv. 2 str. 63/9]ENQ63147.1 hypothetical protein C045_01789 [Brucella melitensis 64/150]ENQ